MPSRVRGQPAGEPEVDDAVLDLVDAEQLPDVVRIGDLTERPERERGPFLLRDRHG